MSRDGDLGDCRQGLRDGPGAPERATLVTGARDRQGVMLGAYEDLAAAEGGWGWVVICETATPHLIDRITGEHLPRLLRDTDPDRAGAHLTGITGPGGFGATRHVTDRHTPRTGLRSQLSELSDLLGQHGAGVLITVNEVHREGLSDLRELGTTIQHTFAEERDVAFVGAGLPSALDQLLSDEVSTFLRRADRRHLRTVSPDQVAHPSRRP